MTGDDGSMTVEVTINGERRRAEIDPRTLLVHAVRESFGLKGTHIGCLTGDCGACTVRLDGRIVKSCLILAVAAEGRVIVTIEGLATDKLDRVQESFWEEHGFQCGYCLPGMLFAAHELLAENPDPSAAEIRHAIDGTLCRCTGYHNVVRAIAAAATRMSPVTRGDRRV